MDIGDTHTFRRYNIMYLQRINKQIDKKLERIIELLEEIAKPVEFTMSEEEFEKAKADFGTSD